LPCHATGDPLDSVLPGTSRPAPPWLQPLVWVFRQGPIFVKLPHHATKRHVATRLLDPLADRSHETAAELIPGRLTSDHEDSECLRTQRVCRCRCGRIETHSCPPPSWYGSPATDRVLCRCVNQVAAVSYEQLKSVGFRLSSALTECFETALEKLGTERDRSSRSKEKAFRHHLSGIRQECHVLSLGVVRR
jgi:hypothetical protein